MLSQPVPSLEARVKATFTLELYDTFLSCRSCSLIKSDIISDLCRPSQTPHLADVSRQDSRLIPRREKRLVQFSPRLGPHDV